jgi:hypothetical protein
MVAVRRLELTFHLILSEWHSHAVESWPTRKVQRS